MAIDLKLKALEKVNLRKFRSNDFKTLLENIFFYSILISILFLNRKSSRLQECICSITMDSAMNGEKKEEKKEEVFPPDWEKNPSKFFKDL